MRARGIARWEREGGGGPEVPVVPPFLFLLHYLKHGVEVDIVTL